MAVAQVAPEVRERGLGLLAEEAPGVLEVPERADVGRVDRVEDAGETSRVGVVGLGLDQDRHVVDGGEAGEVLEGVDDLGVVDVAGGTEVAREEDADEGAAQLAGELEVGHDAVGGLETTLLALELVVGGEAGDLDAHALELRARAGAQARQERLGRGRERVARDAADLDAVKPEVLCHGVDVGPGVRGTADGRERELHGTSPMVTRGVARHIACAHLYHPSWA